MSAAWPATASTTRGWAWPVEQTAMPALKSRNRLPSTSSSTAPVPRRGTIGYARGRDGLVTAASRASTRRPSGPGTSVLRSGTGRAGSSQARFTGAPLRGSPDPSGPLAVPRSTDHRLGLLAHELLDVVEAAAGLAGAARPLPAPERLHARPGAGGRPGLAVDVHHPGLDPAQELLDLGRVLGVEAGGEAVLGVVGQLQGLVEVLDRGHGHERHEQLVLEQPVAGGQVGDHGGGDIVALGHLALEDLAAGQDPAALLLDLLDRLLEPLHGRLVDHRAEVGV